MTTITSLRFALEEAVHAANDAEATNCKLAFLAALGSRLQIGRTAEQEAIGTKCDYLVEILEKLDEYPIGYSRLDATDLRRRVDCISWGKMTNAIAASRELVLDCVRVAAGDCNECQGEEMVFMLDCFSNSIVRHCELCGSSYTLTGDAVDVSQGLKLPTTKQLFQENLLVI